MSKHRRFNAEFKIEAVRLMNESGKPVAEIAEDLGVNANTLYRWCQELGEAERQVFPGKGRLKADDEYIRQLERGLRIVKQERDILKKAVSIFSKGPSQ